MTAFYCMMKRQTLFSLLAGLCLSWSAHSQTPDFTARTDVQAFMQQLQHQHGFSAEELQQTLAQVTLRPNILRLMDRPQQQVNPQWKNYRPQFLNNVRIQGGSRFLANYATPLQQASQQYGVPASIITAILGVETVYGRNQGNIPILDALATLAFDYPRRAPYFRGELISYLLLAKQEHLLKSSPLGSYAGAFGMAQFMPSSYLRYAVDFDGDGKRDIWRSPADAIGSVAHYLSANGWRTGEPVAVPVQVQGEQFQSLLSPTSLKPQHPVTRFIAAGVQVPDGIDSRLPARLVILDGAQGKEYWLTFENFYVITRYNQSTFYAMAVHQLAQAVRS